MNTPKPSSKPKKRAQNLPENKVYKTQEERSWNQLLFAVRSFTMFIHACEESSAISMKYSVQVKEKVKNLMENVQKKGIEQQIAFNSLNEIIEKTNQTLAPFPEQTQYPLFFANNLNIQVKNQILAFQNFLHQEVKCNHIELKVETPFFQDAFNLWLGMSKNSLSPKKCIDELSALIQKVNSKLTKEERYPLPDTSDYDDEFYGRKS